MCLSHVYTKVPSVNTILPHRIQEQPPETPDRWVGFPILSCSQTPSYSTTADPEGTQKSGLRLAASLFPERLTWCDCFINVCFSL